MDYEQRYKEALGLMKDCAPDENGLVHVHPEDIFHELRESEDERIRKELADFIYITTFPVKDLKKKERFLTWLEKQGEHANFRNKIQVGDNVTRNEDGVLVNLSQLRRVAKPADKAEPKFKVEEGKWYVCTQTFVLRGKVVIIKGQTYQAEKDNVIKGENGCRFIDRHDGKASDYFRPWTIDDAKKGDILADKYGVYIYDQLDVSDESACVSICGYQYSDKKFEPESMICNKSDFYPATKEQRTLLFQKMHEAGYEWLEETKELKKIELSDVGHEYYSELLKNDKSDNIADYAYQCVYCMSHDWAIENPTWDNVQSACRLGAKWQKKHGVSEGWSEEDEKMLNHIIGLLGGLPILHDWLKSLKDRVQPQPKQEWSEEDENMVRYIGNAITCKESAKYLEEKGIDMVKAHRWLESFKPQPKQEWGEEDDWMITKIMKVLLSYDTFLTPEETNECVYFLKSLRHQNMLKSLQPQPLVQ